MQLIRASRMGGFKSSVKLMQSILCVSLLMTGMVNGVYNHYRLPTSLKPERYVLKVITNLEEPPNLTFFGEVEILINVVKDTSNITLHANNLNIDDKRIELTNAAEDGEPTCIRDVELEPYNHYFIIHLCQSLLKQQKYRLKLYFDANLNDKLQGYYRSSYIDKTTNETRWLSITQFEPTAARMGFPCFDEPNYKARFYIWLGHHKLLHALSNMPLEKQEPINDMNDYVWSVFEESVPMSTYLVAYTVNDFAYKSSGDKGHVAFATWSRPDAIEQCNYAAIAGPKVLRYYEHLFGIEFPLKKLDQLAIPDFNSGAMENWGLITYRETAMLFAPKVSSHLNKQRIANVISHELAHQWFGNLVTMKWWSDLWLNEGFATYMANVGVRHLHPEWQSFNQEHLENLLGIFRRDAQISSHPVWEPVENSSKIFEHFDEISYKKGASVLHMLHAMLGEQAFFSGIRSYLMNNKYQNAEQDDLWNSFTEQAYVYERINREYNVKTIMDSWTLQEGFPLVVVTRNYEMSSLTITQQRFLDDISLVKENMDKCWWVPITYTTSEKYDFSSATPANWLSCDARNGSIQMEIRDVAAGDEWVLFNLQMSGIYRIMYDLQNWKLLNATLHSSNFNRIHPLNRAQLIGDSLSFSWSGYMQYDFTFDILEYLFQERDYLPWRAAFEGLQHVNRLLRTDTKAYKYFKSFMHYIITPTYYHLGGLNNTVSDNDGTHVTAIHKSLLTRWACLMEITDCVTTAIDYYQQWKEMPSPDTNNIIPVDIRPTVYCTAIRHGNSDDWQFLWRRYLNSNVATEKRTIISSLACTQNTTLLQNYIKLSYDRAGHIRKSDASLAFAAVARNIKGYELAKEFFFDNIDYLHEFYGPNSNDLARMLSPLGNQMVLTKDLENFQQFVSSRDYYFDKSEKTFLSVLETVRVNIGWLRRSIDYLRFNLNQRLYLKNLIPIP